MKKLILLLLTVCICLSVSVMFTACGHEHTYKTEWSSDTTHHWHACEVEGCTEQIDKAEHSYNDGVCICGVEDPNFQQSSSTLTKADYVEVYSKVISEVDAYVNNVSGVSLMRAIVSDTDFIEVPTNQGKNAIKGNTAMLYFLRNLCNTSTFEIVDGFQDIQVIDNVSSPSEQIFQVRINMSYDNQTGEIKSTVYVEDNSNHITSLEFTFIYDFDTETLGGFTVLGIMGVKGNLTASGVNYLKYTNGTLYRINTEAQVFEQFVIDVLAECAELSAGQFDNNLPDYSSQYIEAMLEAFA